MKITYDKHLKLAGIGLVPWTRLGPERWFEDYKIASLSGWDLQHVAGAPQVFALSDNVAQLPKLARLNSQHLLDNAAFQQMLVEYTKDYEFLTYKPVQVPQILLDAGCKFMSMDQALTQTLENKAQFRTQFGPLGIPFPAYDIVERAAVSASLKQLSDLLKGREAMIVQDEMLSGGRGTFLVRTVADLEYALTSIERLGGGKYVVISDLVESAKERSVQCCVTKYGVFVGPLQKQIIGHPMLANLDVADGDRFCGAEISLNDPYKDVYPEIRRHAETIGKQLQAIGYRGIYSVDCLVDASGKVFVLEINPRLTGITPLLTMLYRDGRDIPFYLLHMLELAGIDYEITDTAVDPTMAEGSLLVLHSQQNITTHIQSSPQSGLYDLQSMTLQEQAYRITVDTPDRQLLLQQYVPPGFAVKPGGRLAVGFVSGAVLDEQENLLPDASHAVSHILDNITLTEAL